MYLVSLRLLPEMIIEIELSDESPTHSYRRVTGRSYEKEETELFQLPLGYLTEAALTLNVTAFFIFKEVSQLYIWGIATQGIKWPQSQSRVVNLTLKSQFNHITGD